MKKLVSYFSVWLAIVNFSFAQIADTTTLKQPWQLHGEVSGFIFPDDFYLNPIVWAKKNHLHLEARYNYEDLQTISAFGGYNFSAGNKLYLTATPMLGASAGNTNAIIPGFEGELMYWKLGLYVETEYVFDLDNSDDNFLSYWSEAYFSPKDWIWFGIVTQRIRMQETALDFQEGGLLAFQKNWFTVTGYYFNPFSEEQFGIMNLGVTF